MIRLSKTIVNPLWGVLKILAEIRTLHLSRIRRRRKTNSMYLQVAILNMPLGQWSVFGFVYTYVC